MPPAFGGRGSGHKGVLALHCHLIKLMIKYLFYQHVEVSLFIYLRKHLFCNQVEKKHRLLSVQVFKLVHMHIKYRVVSGLSNRNTISIAYAFSDASKLRLCLPPL